MNNRFPQEYANTPMLALVPSNTFYSYQVRVDKPMFDMKPGDKCHIVQVDRELNRFVVARPDGRQIALDRRFADSFTLVRSHNTNLRTSPLHFYYIEFTY